MSDQLSWFADNGATFVKVQRLSKKPLERGWQSKPRSLAEVTSHVRAGGNVGLLTGRQSNGICILDLDRNFQPFCERFPMLGASPQIIREDAPDRGKIPIKIKDDVPPSRSWTAKGEQSPRIELLADGRQGLLPPSVHPDGMPYRMRHEDRPIVELTGDQLAGIWEDWTGEAMMPDLEQTQRGVVQTAMHAGDDLKEGVEQVFPAAKKAFGRLPSSTKGLDGATHKAYAMKALVNELANVRTAPVGGRNHQLNRSAYSLGQLVGAGVLDEQLVNSELSTAAEAAGLGAGEARATIRSGLTTGTKTPRPLPEPKVSRTSTNGHGQVLSLSERPDDDDLLIETTGASEPNVLDTLRNRLQAVPLAANDKPDRSQLEQVAVSLIEEAAQVTQADVFRLQTEMKRLGLTSKFADDFGRAVRDARKQLAAQQIKTDDLMLPDGWPYAAVNGQTFILSIKTDEKGEKQIVRGDTIAEFQARIVEEAISEEGRRSFVIAGDTAEGMPFRLEIGAAEFSDERTLKADLTSAAGARAPVHAGMMRHVGPAIQQLSDPDIPTVRVYERTGWVNNCFLIPGREREGQRISLPSKLPYDLSGGDLALGLECLRMTFEAVQPEVLAPILGLILEASLARLARWQDERCGVFIRGTTGTMKTTVAKHMMCLYGRRFQEDGMLIKWGEGSTRNALMKLATHAYDLPLLIDNYKPSTGGGGRDFVNFIHNVLEGGDKDRLNRSSQLRETRPVYCWPLVTGEDIPDTDPASLARVLVVTFQPKTVDPAKLAEAQALADHLPAVGTEWIGWLESEEGARLAKWAGEQFLIRRQKWASHLLKIEPDAINRMRVASNLASNQLSFQVASYHPIIGPVVGPYIERHGAGLGLIANEMAHSTGQGLEAQRFLSTLRQLVASHRCKLMGMKKDDELPPPDRMVGWRKSDGLYILPDLARQAVAKVLGDEFFSALSSATLYKQLAEMGMIASSDTGRHTKVIRQGKTRVTTLHLKWEALYQGEDSDEELDEDS